MSWTHEQGEKMIYKDINQTMTYWQRQKILIHSLDLFFCSPFLLHFSPSKLHISSQTQSTKTPFLSSFNLPSSGHHHLSCTPFFLLFTFPIHHPSAFLFTFQLLIIRVFLGQEVHVMGQGPWLKGTQTFFYRCVIKNSIFFYVCSKMG